MLFQVASKIAQKDIRLTYNNMIYIKSFIKSLKDPTKAFETFFIKTTIFLKHSSVMTDKSDSGE